MAQVETLLSSVYGLLTRIQTVEDLPVSVLDDMPTDDEDCAVSAAAASMADSDALLCPICMVDFIEKPLAVLSKCGHLFHYECIHIWVHGRPPTGQRNQQGGLNAHKNCPQCRQKVPLPNGIIRIFAESQVFRRRPTEVPPEAAEADHEVIFIDDDSDDDEPSLTNSVNDSIVALLRQQVDVARVNEQLKDRELNELRAEMHRRMAEREEQMRLQKAASEQQLQTLRTKIEQLERQAQKDQEEISDLRKDLKQTEQKVARLKVFQGVLQLNERFHSQRSRDRLQKLLEEHRLPANETSKVIFTKMWALGEEAMKYQAECRGLQAELDRAKQQLSHSMQLHARCREELNRLRENRSPPLHTSVFPAHFDPKKSCVSNMNVKRLALPGGKVAVQRVVSKTDEENNASQIDLDVSLSDKEEASSSAVVPKIPRFKRATPYEDDTNDLRAMLMVHCKTQQRTVQAPSKTPKFLEQAQLRASSAMVSDGKGGRRRLRVQDQ